MIKEGQIQDKLVGFYQSNLEQYYTIANSDKEALVIVETKKTYALVQIEDNTDSFPFDTDLFVTLSVTKSGDTFQDLATILVKIKSNSDQNYATLITRLNKVVDDMVEIQCGEEPKPSLSL
ncbi:hypothetical protein GLW08_21390 [Pontibacillus yanchengensis]|uniref:Uncharacterized protein n=2 Tax=Pontibacillus yanchengensis TaxID=462910 RepID=A0ACC7VKA4_9BACI|nr:hypothetical protein [Pontibacillus yanchengensis]MYL35439.1 hypothetical protein [Pontibacillus yanchengensis]MYL55858.1 hypothetical protein [Pontibacillus yanchengensis]